MIGLVDLDLQQSTSVNLCTPNIEIMKLANYYQTEENHFCRLVGLDETDLTPYDKVYLFSEAEEKPQVPEVFLRASNVVLGGTAFTNGIYKPFQNEIIDYTLARPTIYKSFLSAKYADGLKDSVVRHILDDSYYRIYAGDNKLPIPSIFPRKRIFIYDTNFFVPDWQKTINKIIERNPSSINPIHTVHCRTVDEYFQFREYNKITKDVDVILDFDLPLSYMPSLMKKYKNKFLADIRPSSRVYISLGGTFETQLQYRTNFVYKMNLLYIFWSNQIPLKIKYITPLIGHSDPLINISKMISLWSQSETNKVKSINDKIPKDKSLKEIRPERAERDWLLERNPSAKSLFFQTYDIVSNGGFWKYEY